MPALLFILPVEVLGVIAAAYASDGARGVTALVTFDEEEALKTGASMRAGDTNLPLN